MTGGSLRMRYFIGVLIMLPLLTSSAAFTPSSSLLTNGDFSKEGGATTPAANWLKEGLGYAYAPSVRHGSSGASIKVDASNSSTLHGAVQVVHAPPAVRQLRISGWSRAVGVTGGGAQRSDGYSLFCDLQLADGSHI